jgi:AcrR family transcriptional regulator
MDARARILDAALKLVFDSGVAALTQPRIAQAAGLRQSHLTYYFPTRAVLLEAVAQHMMDGMMRNMQDIAHAHTGKGAEALAKAIGEAVSDPRRARVMLALVVASDEEPGIKVWLRAFIEGLRARIGQVLADAGLDASRAALFHTMLVGAAILNVARDDDASRREARGAVRAALELLA